MPTSHAGQAESQSTAAAAHARPFEGLIAATFTPLHADATLNLDVIAPYARHLTANGVRGAFVCGTNGEYPSLTLDERMRVAEAWRAAQSATGAAQPQLRLIVHVAHNCLADAQQLARHAQSIGADAIAAAPPSLFRPQNLDEILIWSAEVAAAAPALPFYYYHIPGSTGVSASMTNLVPAALKRIPTFAGVKFSSSDMADFIGALQAGQGRLDFFSGSDEMLLAYLAMGGRGAVGSTYNFMAAVFQDVLKAFDEGDLAAAQQAQNFARAVCVLIGKYRPLPAQKLIMRWLGVDCGPARLPLINPSDEAAAQFRAELTDLGFFERIPPSAN